MSNELTRDFTVAVFVVHYNHVLLHPHAKIGLWLPPGGHIDTPELPDEAAIREIREEAGIDIELVGERSVELTEPDMPVQLVRPFGIQLETITPEHQHIDLIYFGRVVNAPIDGMPDVLEPVRWLKESGFGDVPLNEEVLAWAHRALEELS